MALQPYTRTTYTGPSMTGLYQTALSRWLASQKESRAGFKEAEEPLMEAKGLLVPGGGYGAAQRLEIEEAARKAKSEALANLVATGMSSGSMTTGLTARIGADVGKAKAGIEESRIQNLMQLLSQLSGLRAAAAGQTGAAGADPFTASMLGNLGGIEQLLLSKSGLQTGVSQGTISQEDIPKLHL